MDFNHSHNILIKVLWHKLVYIFVFIRRQVIIAVCKECVRLSSYRAHIIVLIHWAVICMTEWMWVSVWECFFFLLLLKIIRIWHSLCGVIIFSLLSFGKHMAIQWNVFPSISPSIQWKCRGVNKIELILVMSLNG